MPIERRILIGFAAALLILLGIGSISYFSIQDLLATALWVQRTHEVLGDVAEVKSAIADLQGAGRGYVITGKGEYLAPYGRATTRLRELERSLRLKTADNPNQQQRLDELESLVIQRVAIADEVVKVRREQGFEPAAALIQTDRGKQLTDAIRAILDGMEGEERALLRQRRAEIQARARRTYLTVASGSVAAIGIVCLALWALRRDFQARRHAEQTLRESEGRYRDLVENSGVIICTHDAEGKILSSNRALANVAGYEHVEDVVGHALSGFLAPDMADRFPKYLQQVLGEGRARGMMKIRTRDGAERFLEYNNSLRYDPDGPAVVRGTAIDVTERMRAELQLRQSQEDLAALVNDLQLRSLEITRLSEISDVLQTCQNPIEAYEAIAHSVPKMFPMMSGALCILSDSRNVVEAVATWGSGSLGDRVFSPDDCWALRRGRPNFSQEGSMAQRCKHVSDEEAGSHLCVPMIAHGETLGIFYLRGQTLRDMPSTLIEAHQRLAVTIGEQVGMALANLKLRETLRQQSIRDSLTGLFNRRYMEESLDRELRRSTRNSRPMAVVMLDIDHFKRFNDTFGHEAGDLLLHELGAFLSSHVRGDDIACRYGGEEFALILPEASLDAARQRAEWLRENIRQVEVQHQGAPLGTITISLGIASYPEHDSTPRGLLHAADQALYRAKREGRDRVVLAGALVEEAPPPVP